MEFSRPLTTHVVVSQLRHRSTAQLLNTEQNDRGRHAKYSMVSRVCYIVIECWKVLNQNKIDLIKPKSHFLYNENVSLRNFYIMTLNENVTIMTDCFNVRPSVR